ncbi:MAG: hypothetical protein CMF49_01625 [Legionellales bacterium]|nr:hypothetical protein [Legionellales bacterium]|tara:strand:- start:669 stop:920 length:252 start_codon:yes stop_codon:yes gene_type:complete
MLRRISKVLNRNGLFKKSVKEKKTTEAEYMAEVQANEAKYMPDVKAKPVSFNLSETHTITDENDIIEQHPNEHCGGYSITKPK